MDSALVPALGDVTRFVSVDAMERASDNEVMTLQRATSLCQRLGEALASVAVAGSDAAETVLEPATQKRPYRRTA